MPATCPKCKARVTIMPGEQPVCSGCGAKFKVPAAKPETVAVAAGGPEASAEDSEPEPFTINTSPPPLAFTAAEPSDPTPARQTFTVSPAALNPSGLLPATTTVIVPPERTSVVAKVIWGLFICFVGLSVSMYVNSQRGETSAIRQAASGVDYCLWLIAGYAFCRAIDSITKY